MTAWSWASSSRTGPTGAWSKWLKSPDRAGHWSTSTASRESVSTRSRLAASLTVLVAGELSLRTVATPRRQRCARIHPEFARVLGQWLPVAPCSAAGQSHLSQRRGDRPAPSCGDQASCGGAQRNLETDAAGPGAGIDRTHARLTVRVVSIELINAQVAGIGLRIFEGAPGAAIGRGLSRRYEVRGGRYREPEATVRVEQVVSLPTAVAVQV